MNGLPDVAPMDIGPRVTDEDARTVLDGLAPGWYTVRKLYPRYEAMMAQRGQPSASRNCLGSAMRRVAVEVRKTHNNVSAYRIG